MSTAQDEVTKGFDNAFKDDKFECKFTFRTNASGSPFTIELSGDGWSMGVGGDTIEEVKALTAKVFPSRLPAPIHRRFMDMLA